ncbi:unnamed protein product [Owenia fusiformis]|uniref:Uncharacterized protein n=1 Tax=Owenia fusiformis TaxID=6347 RepID=A0A8S4N5J1_OWEFU|nr:unnamed protein product [Owenia fusiformis]
MEITFLGTGSAYPTPTRGASCIIFRNDGNYWMFDCGEGSQIQLMRSSIKPGKISKIFVTHLHGDHLFGLPGLMCTISQNCPDHSEPIELYGPQGLRRYIRTSLELSRSMLGFDYVVHELMLTDIMYPPDWKDWKVDHESQGPLHPNEKLGENIVPDEQGVWQVFSDATLTVKASWLTHRVPTVGYVIEEATTTGKLDCVILKAKGVPAGPLFAKIKAGESITAPSGEIILPKDVLGPAKLGRKVVFLGDTSNSENMMSISQNASVVVHEATLENEMHENALEKGHSTPAMAAEFSKGVNAKQLILTHFSQRYRTVTQETNDEETCKSVKKLQDQAKDIFGDNVLLAEDLVTIPVHRTTKQCS